MILGLMIVASSTFAGDLITFVPGTPAKATEVNDNFSELASRIKALEARLDACNCNDVIFSEDFENTSLANYKLVGSENTTWNLTTNAFDGNHSLKGVSSDSSSASPAIYVNTTFNLPSNTPIKIEAYVKNTGATSWNHPNGIIFGASDSEMSGYAPQIEHNQYMSLVKLNAPGATIIDRTSNISVTTNTWYKWVIYYNPNNNYTKFQVYNLQNKLLGEVETNNTPPLSNKFGFRAYRGDVEFDDITISVWDN